MDGYWFPVAGVFAGLNGLEPAFRGLPGVDCQEIDCQGVDWGVDMTVSKSIDDVCPDIFDKIFLDHTERLCAQTLGKHKIFDPFTIFLFVHVYLEPSHMMLRNDHHYNKHIEFFPCGNHYSQVGRCRWGSGLIPWFFIQNHLNTFANFPCFHFISDNIQYF